MEYQAYGGEHVRLKEEAQRMTVDEVMPSDQNPRRIRRPMLGIPTAVELAEAAN